MKVFKDPLGADEPPRGAVLTIGNFDGIHLGHQAILRYVVTRAEELGTVAAAMTLDPHPVKLLRPKLAPQLLTTLDQRLELIERTGIETCLVVPFTHRLARMSARAFVTDVLVDRLRRATGRNGDQLVPTAVEADELIDDLVPVPGAGDHGRARAR